MEKIKTVDALFAKEFVIKDQPKKKKSEFSISINSLKMNNLEEISMSIQPISLIINSSSIIK